jgi:hypothetical protein
VIILRITGTGERAEPKFRILMNDVNGYYIELFFEYPGYLSRYATDSLMAYYLNAFPKQYSLFLKYLGAIGPRNNITYFKTEKEAKVALMYLIAVFNGITTIDRILEGKFILDDDGNIIKNDSGYPKDEEKQNSNRPSQMRHGTVLHSWNNKQQYQNTPFDINRTTKDSKEMNPKTILPPINVWPRGKNKYTVL